MNNEELLEFIEKYEKLIHKKVQYYYKNFPILNIEYDELYSIAIETLVVSARKFNKDKGFSFSSYAIKSIENKILKEIRKKTNQIKYISSEISLNSTININSNTIDFSDIVEDSKINLELEAITMASLNMALEKLKNQEKLYKCLKLYLEGYNQSEIAEKIGDISQTYVSKLLLKSKKTLRLYLYEVI